MATFTRACIFSTSYPGSSLFLPRESTLVSAGHVSPLSKQLPTRVDSLFFKKRREKRMQIFSHWHEDRGMEVISSLFLKDRDLKKSTVYYLRRFRSTNNADFPSTNYFTVGSICFESDKKLLVRTYCPNKMSHTHLFAIYFIYWPNNASKILIIKADAALVYFYLQASM